MNDVRFLALPRTVICLFTTSALAEFDAGEIPGHLTGATSECGVFGLRGVFSEAISVVEHNLIDLLPQLSHTVLWRKRMSSTIDNVRNFASNLALAFRMSEQHCKESFEEHCDGLFYWRFIDLVRL
jgi:hypothetical protein